MSRILSEEVTLAGPAGGIEAVIEWPEAHPAPSAFIVVCHPHPLHGGAMQNKVVTTVARSAHACGAASIRFNFRGVGASVGTHDDGRGEVDDALAAVAAGRQRWPEAALWLAGFSFGGVVALRASVRAEAGAVAFSDDGVAVASAGMMNKALTYVAMTGKVFMQHCEDPQVGGGGRSEFLLRS